MPSLHDLAIDLINDAKGGKTVGQKLYFLEQIKEIVFHRDTSILSEIAPDLINDFMVERSSPIRKFLVSFAAEWLQFDFTAATPLLLTLYGFFLASEGGDGSLRQIVTELTKIYDRVVIHITDMPIKTRGGGSNVPDPKSYWGSLRSIVSRLIDMISSDRTEFLRTQSLKLAASMILFGLPAEKLSSDPRLAKSRPQGGDSSRTLSAADIPLHHPFINRNDLEQEAESIFSKMLLWASKGGPQGHPFSPSQMSLLGGIIANIASLRPKKSTNAATALILVIQGKGNVCHLMVKEDRDNIARGIQKLLRATYAIPDPDGLMGKLRAALDGLVSLAPITNETTQEIYVTEKRSLGHEEDGEEIEGDDVHLRAIAAIDIAENNIRTKEPRIEPAVPGNAVTAPQGGSSMGVSAASADTELSSELSNFPDLSPSVKLISLHMAPNSTSLAIMPISGMPSSSGLLIRPSPPPSDTYADLALQSMQRILDSFDDVQKFGMKASSAHLKLSVRMILAITLLDLAESKASLRVPVIATLSPSVVGALIDSMPLEVYIPRSLWIVLSHAIMPSPSLSQKNLHVTKVFSKDKIELILYVLTEVFNRAEHKGSTLGDDGRMTEVTDELFIHPFKAVYDDACIAVLARLLQGVDTRVAAREIMMGLPSVPSNCLKMLKLLVHTGTRAVAPLQVARRDAQASSNRGTRAEALSLLGQLVFSPDESAGFSALYHLLWCGIADDFEIRSKAVALLVGKIAKKDGKGFPIDQGIYDTVILFCIHSLVALVGYDTVNDRIQLLSAHKDVDISSTSKVFDTVKAEDGMEVQESKEGSDERCMDVAVTDDVNANKDILTLQEAIECFDNGKIFLGSFPECPSSTSSSGGVEKVEGCARRSLQLLSQMSVTEPSLLNILFGIYGASSVAATELSLSVDDKGASPSSIAEAVTTTPSEAAADKSAVIENKYTIICNTIEKELMNIIPIVSKRKTPKVLFSLLSASGSDPDPASRPLLESTLGIMHLDYNMPASSELIEAVREYIKSPLFARSLEDTTQIDGNEIKTVFDSHEDKKRVAVVNLFSPLLGGLNSAELLDIIPKVLRAYSDQPESIKNCFRRIYSARPPAMSKAALFAALHRVDCDGSGLKQKTLLDSISICLGKKDDFRSDVIREALSDLLSDSIPAQALMRTAILSAQSHGNEMKKFMLSDIIPNLIRKRVWLSAPKIWDGVNHALKIFAEHKNAEPTLRCILGLPGAQLKGVFKAAPKVKVPLANLLKALSAEEREEAVSGKWAGLLVSNVEGDGGTGPAPSSIPIDIEKLKILKELSPSIPA